jgi:hypothetical protein
VARYVYDPVSKTMVRGSSPRRVDGPSGDGWRFSDRLYSANPFVAPDGTVIDSKAKHRDYMKRAGVTTMDDFTDQWAKARKERDEFYTGTSKQHAAERREDIQRTIEQLSQRRG